MSMCLRASACCVLILAPIWLLGCGGPSDQLPTAAVSGKVTLDGKPLPAGSLLFIPDAGGPPAQANIGTDGSYTLGTYYMNDGAIIGKFKVAIKAIVQPKGGPGLPEDSINGNAPALSLIPEIYGDLDKSGLTADVQDKTNVIDFELTKSKK